MFSHVVIFWTQPNSPNAPDEVIAAANQYLAPISGIVHFQGGKMVRSHRDVVDQTYQVGLCIQFETKKAHDEYQEHPSHLKFVASCQTLWTKVTVYDFE